MILWDLTERLSEKGWTNPNQLAKGAGLSYPVAWRIIREADKPIARVDIATLETLAKALGVANPLRLLKHARK